MVNGLAKTLWFIYDKLEQVDFSRLRTKYVKASVPN